MADRINLPKTIVDRANNLFKQVHDGKNLKGRSNDAKASACLYIACRQEGVPRTFKEICAVSKISKKEIGRCFKLTLKALATSVDLITTADFMSRFCANLGMPKAFRNTPQPAANPVFFLQTCPTRYSEPRRTSPGKRSRWILYLDGHRFRWPRQLSTWHHRPPTRRRPTKRSATLPVWPT